MLKQALNNNTVDVTKRLFGTRLGGGSFAFVFEKRCHASNINYTVGNVFSQHHNTRARSLAYCLNILTCLQRSPALINVGQRKDRMFDGRGPNPVDIFMACFYRFVRLALAEVSSPSIMFGSGMSVCMTGVQLWP